MILIININNEGGVLSPFLFSFVLDLYKISLKSIMIEIMI